MNSEANIFRVVEMDTVPVSSKPGRYGQLWRAYEAMKQLGLGERKAIELHTGVASRVFSWRAQLKQYAEEDGLMLCTSRTDDYSKMYAWLVKRETNR